MTAKRPSEISWVPCQPDDGWLREWLEWRDKMVDDMYRRCMLPKEAFTWKPVSR